MSGAPGHHDNRFRFVGRKRRPSEDKRFVTGRGRFVADVRLPGMLHAALLSSPHPAARIRAIRLDAARAMPGVRAVLTGADLVGRLAPLQHGLDLPGIVWYPLAVGQVRYVGEWVAVVVAEDRYRAEDAVEAIEVDWEPLPFVVDPEAALDPSSPPVHADYGHNTLFRRTFTWGDVDGDFAAAPHELSYRVHWGRNSTVPIETFGVVARWHPGDDLLDVWASIQMPKFAEQIASALKLPANAVRAHFDVDVGGSYGVKRGIKHSVLAGHLARVCGAPVRLLEDRLENMAGGDAHGPDRIFDVRLAFDGEGRVSSMRMRALDDCGCWPGRAPLQLGKPVGSIVGPYRIGSVEYEAISVCTNKTAQVAVRGFGQAPTNYAIESGIDRVARRLGLDPLEVRRRNFIAKDQFPYTIPSGTAYDSGDYQLTTDALVDLARMADLVARRDAMRTQGRIAGIGLATVLEPGGGNAAFEPLFNPKNPTTTWMESCVVKVDMAGGIVALMATSTSGQGHETLVSTIVGEILDREPDSIRVLHSDSMAGMPTNSPVASRMAIMLGGAAQGAAEKVKAKMLAIAAHDLGVPVDRLAWRDGDAFVADDPSRRLSWAEMVLIAHRLYHRMPPGAEPGLQALHCWEVPNGGILPTADGRVQMYPCFSFEAHAVLVEIDVVTGKVSIPDYFIAHDCGTVINPDIVRGMVLGGIAHGIGAALYERFEYDADGQLLAGSFVDYLLPSVFEVPEVHMAETCTPSPITPMGQKGCGEGGYMGAGAAVANAVNDALAPFGAELDALPLRMHHIEAALAARRAAGAA